MRFPFTARHLYLLALFQLIGGPLALIPVLTVGKMVVTTTQQEGFSSGIAELAQSDTWQTVTVELVREIHQTPQPASSSTDIPLKKPDSKSTFFAIAWHTPDPPIFSSEPSSPPHEKATHLIGLDAQAPPGPPPRSI